MLTLELDQGQDILQLDGNVLTMILHLVFGGRILSIGIIDSSTMLISLVICHSRMSQLKLASLQFTDHRILGMKFLWSDSLAF